MAWCGKYGLGLCLLLFMHSAYSAVTIRSNGADMADSLLCAIRANDARRESTVIVEAPYFGPGVQIPYRTADSALLKINNHE